jgi:hypothetical protein
MQIRSVVTMVSLLATILAIPVIQAIGDTSSDVRATATATARSSRVHLAVLQAPIGHRQPTLDDLPLWLRETEKPGSDANSTQDSHSEQRQTPRVLPNDGVPQICEPC